MSKHTPGPWTVDGPPWNQVVWSSAENRVCFLAHSNGLDDERDIATGRLIAAAPELLDAVRDALAVLRTASKQLSEDHRLVLSGRGWGWQTLAKLEGIVAKIEASPAPLDKGGE